MKRIFLFFVLVFCILFSACAQNVNDFEYSVNDDNTGIIITGYKGNVKDVRIPESINGMPVSHIGDWAFEGKGLTSISLPSGLTHIGLSAFKNNQLTSIILPNGITIIRDGTFENNQLTSVVFPNSLTSINNWAFRNNKLTSVVFPSGLTLIGFLAFRNNQLTSVSIPNSTEYAFSFGSNYDTFDSNVIVIRR